MILNCFHGKYSVYMLLSYQTGGDKQIFVRLSDKLFLNNQSDIVDEEVAILISGWYCMES